MEGALLPRSGQHSPDARTKKPPTFRSKSSDASSPFPFMPFHRTLFLPIALWPLLAFTAQADTATDGWKDVRPLLEQKCYECHGGKKTKGGVDLKKLSDDPHLATEFEMWEKVKEAISSGDMPPD